MIPARFEWQTRCEFNAYCKHSLRNELVDTLRESKSRKRREVNFSDLAQHWEKYMLIIKGSSEYFRIAKNKLRKLAEENASACWVMMNGNRIQIKRKQSEKFINTLEVI